MTNLMELIHGDSVYKDFASRFETDLAGWGGHREFFEHMLRISRAKFAMLPDRSPVIVEVGSWKGKSACVMASLLDELSQEYHDIKSRAQNVPVNSVFDNAKIVCVDTWLGAAEFNGPRTPSDKRYLMPINGYPQIYYQFLSNVVNENLDDRIVPFPQTSTNAARFFEKHDVKADLIYVDASHEYVDVLADLNAWYPRLNEGGIMFGDDFCAYWSGVIRAVTEFAAQNDLMLQTKQYSNPDGQAASDYWILSKNGIVLP